MKSGWDFGLILLFLGSISSSCTWIYGSLRRTEYGSSSPRAPVSCDPKLSGPAYGGGTGSAADPFLICSVEQFNKIGLSPSDWSKSFLISADLDLASLTGGSYNRIGNSTKRFTGVLDGGSKTISNFTSSSTGEVVGLIAYAGSGAVIKNLSLENVNIVTDSQVGSVVGDGIGITLDQVSVTNIDLECASMCGGVVGASDGITVSRSQLKGTSNTIRAEANSTDVGGFVGRVFNSGTFSEVTIGSVDLPSNYTYLENAGGLVGRGSSLTLNRVIADSFQASSATLSVGGLVGLVEGTSSSSISDSGVSGGSLNVSSRAGGLVGDQAPGAGLLSISRSYSYVTVMTSGSGFGGGLVGRFYTSVSIDRSVHRSGTSINSNLSGRSGGLVGAQHTSAPAGSLAITNSMAQGHWSSENGTRLGGLLGAVQAGTNISVSNSLALTQVTGVSSVGSLHGSNTGGNFVVTDSLFDSTIGPAAESPSGDVLGWSGRTTAQLQNPATYASWTDPIWVFTNGSYPKLSFEP